MTMKLPRGAHLKLLFGAVAAMWIAFVVTVLTVLGLRQTALSGQGETKNPRDATFSIPRVSTGSEQHQLQNQPVGFCVRQP